MGNADFRHYAIRRGTELHRLNFGAPEKPAEPLLNFAEHSEKVAREIRNLITERDELKEWKRQQMGITSQCDMQEVGRLLGMTLGTNIHANLIPKIQELIEDRDNLKRDNDFMQITIREQKSAAHNVSLEVTRLRRRIEELESENYRLRCHVIYLKMANELLTPKKP
jgi:hypothetical protein